MKNKIVHDSNYRNIVEWSPNPIFIHQEGIIVYVNPATVKMFGVTSFEDLIGRQVLDLVHPDFRDIVIERRKQILEKNLRTPSTEIKYIKADGTEIDTEVQGTLITYDGKPAIHVALRDLTKYKLAEAKLRKMFSGLIDVLSGVINVRDPYTSDHQNKVSCLARKIAQGMGLSSEQIEEIRMASLIHDVGKMSIPAEILSKPSKLSTTQYMLIKEHAQSGFDILKDVELPEAIKQTVLQHHERIDGSGYPQGLSGDNIILEARIVAVADVVDAIESHRPYRPALGVDAAIVELMENRGILYDLNVADVCIQILIDGKKCDKKIVH